MRILFIGDVLGSPGRRAVKMLLPPLVLQEGISLVVANVENAAGGVGVTPDVVDEFLGAGGDGLTP